VQMQKGVTEHSNQHIRQESNQHSRQESNQHANQHSRQEGTARVTYIRGFQGASNWGRSIVSTNDAWARSGLDFWILRSTW